LNGKVERSHRTDQEEFYQLLTYTDDVDLNKKLATWEEFYNVHRPHGAHNGKTPYEALRTMLE
jgi:transposase InsO family protein